MKKQLQISEFVKFLMRVSALQIFLTFLIFNLSYAKKAEAQEILEKKLSINLNNTNLRTALNLIEQQTGARFLYQSHLVTKKKVTLRFVDESLREVLDNILLPLNIVYEADKSHIILHRKDEEVQSSTVPLNDQESSVEAKLIQGQVTDALDGSPLPGVNIIVKGTATGTTTDIDGNYSLEIDSDSTVLIFSFIGYNSEEIVVGNRSVINLSLIQDIQSLDEVVVVAYGQQKKSTLTSAVSTVKGEEVANRPVVNLTNNLAGRVAGVIVTQGGGEPGFDGSTIRIRGVGTNGNADPLLVVDGIYRDFSQLDPNTIESYTVLKDAAAVAPYGVAGANGVILVTTKQGKTGAPTLTYNSYVAFQNPTRAVPFVNSVEYALMRNEAAKNEGDVTPFTDEQIAEYRKTVNGDPDAKPDLYPNSNGIRDILQKNALITYNHLGLSGGTDRFKYYTALGYTTQEGQWESIKVKRYNLMANLEAEATKTTTVSLKFNGWLSDNTYPGVAAASIMYNAVRIPPTSAIYYSNGLWGQYTGGSLVGTAFHSGYDRTESTQIYTTLSIEQQLPFIEGLSVKGQISYDPNFQFDKRWLTPIPVYTLNTTTDPFTYDLGYQGPAKAGLEEVFTQGNAFTYQAYLNYANTFGKHSVSFLGVVEGRTVKGNNFNAEIINYNANIDELNTGSAAKTDYIIGGSSSAEKQFGYVYRVAYSFDNKYLAEVAGRYDGHFSFGPGRRYNFFPAFSLGWNLSEENFIGDNLPMFDLLKIRGSYGVTGNLPNDADFEYLSGYTLSNSGYNLGGIPGQGLAALQEGNPYITWEESTKTDIGLEASLWNNKLILEADVFWERRKNMLMGQDALTPLEYGITLGDANVGVMDNRGFELLLGTNHSFQNGIGLSVIGTFTYAKNEMIEILETSATFDNPNRRRTGRALNTIFGYQALGYFQAGDFNPDGSLKDGIAVVPEADVHPGDIRYADLSGPEGKPDGIISADDETAIGLPRTPQINFGLNPTITFKGFDLDILFQGAARTSLYLTANNASPFDGSASATKIQYEDHWTPANTDALYPRLTSAPTSNNTQRSSWWVRDGEYLRLKSMQLGYTLPQSLIERWNVVKSLKVYVSGQNLFTWTPNYDEILDPEIGDAGNGNSNGQYYYQQRVVSVGVNISF